MKQYLEKRGIYITWSQLVMRIIFDLVGFLLALLPAGLTLYLTDVWITSGTHMPTSWILGIIVCVFLIHFYQFYFVNYNSQMNADRMAGNYRQHLAQKILSSSIPAYESQNKARIQNMANDVSAIYTVSSYLVTVPANLVKVMIIIGLLLFYASPSVALTAIILIPLYMVPSFLNKSELERLVAKEREAGDLWFQEFDVILNGKVSITLNKVENYMQNRYNEALKSYLFYPNFIFPGTVRENIVCGRKISNTQYQELETVLQLPPADKQVTIKPENLSLGEKQKIYLARTLLGNSSCILLDEPGSNLDEKTEHSLIDHLLKLKEKKLILVISHNAYYDAVADKTYEIRKGMMHPVQSH